MPMNGLTVKVYADKSWESILKKGKFQKQDSITILSMVIKIF